MTCNVFVVRRWTLLYISTTPTEIVFRLVCWFRSCVLTTFNFNCNFVLPGLIIIKLGVIDYVGDPYSSNYGILLDVCEQLAHSPLYDLERLLDEPSTSQSQAKRSPFNRYTSTTLSFSLPGTSVCHIARSWTSFSAFNISIPDSKPTNVIALKAKVGINRRKVYRRCLAFTGEAGGDTDSSADDVSWTQATHCSVSHQ